MSKYNLKNIDVEDAYAYASRRFKQSGKNIKRSLPNFGRNYILLQESFKYALDIPRREMPVIEPKDMKKFQEKIRSGHIDIFKPYASTKLFPKDLTAKRSSEWLTLGLKDGSISDDMLKAKIIKMPAYHLKPLQSQIWLDVMIDGMLQYGIPRRGAKVLNTTIIVSDEGYIIDGHHRWAQVMLGNPKLEMSCLLIPLAIDKLLKMTKTYGIAIGNRPNY